MRKIAVVCLLSIFLIGLGLFSFGCGSATVSGEVGKIIGKIYAANGTTAIGGATVYLKSDPTKTTTTAPDGSFSLQGDWIVAGTYTLVASKGSFSIEFSVTVSGSGVETNVGTQEVAPGQPGIVASIPDLAVIKGQWDKIEDMIISLGYTYTTIEVSDLDDYAFISTFEAIFINCGTSGSSLNASREANLKKFVEDGGKSVYASDFAGDYIENTWPSAIDFYGSYINSSSVETLSPAKIGKGSQSLEATVTDSFLRDNVLGKSTVNLYYDLGGWVVISAEGTGTTVMLRGSPEVTVSSYSLDISDHGRNVASFISADTISTRSNLPLAVKFQPAGAAKGTVLFTTFHNEAQASLVTEDTAKILREFILGL